MALGAVRTSCRPARHRGEIARNGDVIHEALVQGLIVNEPAVGYRLALPTPR